MILPFSTQLNGKPTYFVEKIWEGLLRYVIPIDLAYVEYLDRHEEKFGKHWDFLPEDHERMTNPKIHTIREDKNNRWKRETKIDFFINCRQKDMFRFAPVLPVVSVQDIQIQHSGDYIYVFIDDKQERMWCNFKSLDSDFYTSAIDCPMTFKLAQNDGFDTIEDFFAYFNEDFTGKLIHWTNLKY